jgi:hypothetical protein
MPFPTYITSAKLKPLIPTGLTRFDPKRVLRSLEREVLKSLRGKILQEAFSPRAKRALTQGVQVTYGPKSITVVATHPAFIPLLEGQRKKQMTWLTKARAPIPIVTDDGKLIFRWATARSMRNGSWVHPGREPTTVIERAKEEARKVIKARMTKELRKQMRESLRSAR